MAPTFGFGYAGQRKSKSSSKKGQAHTNGKKRKVSGGHSSGFIPDYHAVETMDESEGLNYSGHVDIDTIASEVSCAPKRKFISTYTDYTDPLGVSFQHLSLSKMTQSERRDLKFRLRSELEHVRAFQKTISSLSSDVVVLSPYSDIRSCSDGQRKPPLESFQRSMEVCSPQTKKRAPSGKNGSRTKRAPEKQSELVKQAVTPGTSLAMLMKQCQTLLSRMMSHQFGWVFNTPVDVVTLNIPDYYNVIKHPMDLGTVKSKLISGQYSSPLEFAADVRLTFSNALTYNPVGNDVHFMAETLSKYFEVRWKPIEKKLPVVLEAPRPSRLVRDVETETASRMSSPKKKVPSPDRNFFKQEPFKRIMSDVEKHKLSSELEALLAELPDSIIDFLKAQSSGASQTGEDEIEIDLDALRDDTLFELRKLLDDYLLDKQKKQEKAEPCEMELHIESGLSNSSEQLCKANDPVDEDVDIGGNDPPISIYTPVEIQRDGALRNSKRDSSSSSSGDSGSSSSDSDSACSDGVLDGANVTASVTKEVLSSEAISEQKKTSDLGVAEFANDSLNELNEVGQNSESKSVEADDHQEGEITASERQVSPDKLYRAALLRNRFADTILKAQEKTLEKGEKQDPEKLRLEREELERRKREEKARLQAEAKAAEEAQKKAEAEAAAESRRRRELEREAARQALLKMEKTVDINENSQLLKDLEMLRSSAEEELESLDEEASPAHSQNGLGSFKLHGSNPLEQLGLYMKVDDEEEEEIEPQEAMNDPEEGEID